MQAASIQSFRIVCFSFFFSRKKAQQLKVETGATEVLWTFGMNEFAILAPVQAGKAAARNWSVLWPPLRRPTVDEAYRIGKALCDFFHFYTFAQGAALC